MSTTAKIAAHFFQSNYRICYRADNLKMNPLQLFLWKLPVIFPVKKTDVGKKRQSRAVNNFT